MKLSEKTKKQLILHLPYVIVALICTNIGEAWRLSSGSDFGEKLLGCITSMGTAFATPLPSLHPFDLLIGACCGGAMYLAVYLKGKNAKKYRHNEEYGSARWGTAKDIEPFIDPVFENNVILTKTERLTMSSRPKNPANARNKNVLIVGGSGSGKTRFWLKPNLLQMHSSYVITDPKGDIVVDCGARMGYVSPESQNRENGKTYDCDSAFQCGGYRNQKRKCCSHYVKTSVLEAVILQSIQAVSDYVLEDEEGFIEEIKTQWESCRGQSSEADLEKLKAAKARMDELDMLIQNLYESQAKGLIPERHCKRLMEQYDSEQLQLAASIEELECVVQTETDNAPKKADINRFISLVRSYQDISVLTDDMLYSFIDRIEVHAPESGEASERIQQIDVYFQFIGKFIPPVTEKMIAAEEEETKHLEEEKARRRKESHQRSDQKRKEKRAALKAAAEAGDPQAQAEYEALLEKGREQNRKYAAKVKARKESDPEYKQKSEEKERAASGDPEAMEKLETQRIRKNAAANAAYHKLIEEAQTDPEAAEELARRRRKSVDATTRYKDNLKEQAAAGDEQAIAKLEAQRQYNREYCAAWRSKQEDFIEEEEAIA